MSNLECANCGATINAVASICDRCGAELSESTLGWPSFNEEARAMGRWLGGLLKLHSVNGNNVRFVGWCPAGAFGLDASGKVVWVEDWGYMSELTVVDGELRFAGKLADVETGQLICSQNPSGIS